MKQWLTLVSLCLLVATLFVGSAAGAGSLTVTFKDKNGASLAYAYVYLRNAVNEPPMEKYFTPPDLILGPSGGNGTITATGIPEGEYYVRITRRNPLGSAIRPIGPPEEGDYTWFQATPITISTNQTTNLGTKVAWNFGSALTSISGTVKNWSGTPLSGRYVKATIVPCVQADYSSQNPDEWRDSNRCGPEKHMAMERTDANGNFTLFLRAPGTFYVYESTCLGDQHQQYSGNPCIGYGTGPVTVNAGEQKTVNIVGN